MAENTAAKKEEEESPSASVASSSASSDPQKPTLLIAIVIINMIAMLSVAGILWTSHKAERDKPRLQDVVQGEKESETHKNADGEAVDELGKLVPLESFLVNLAGSRGNKLVRITMELEVNGEKVVEELEKRKPQVRDIIIILLSSKTYDQVTTKEGKIFLRDEIRDTVNSFLVKGKIKSVYFTDFIIN